MQTDSISKQTIKRLPLYLEYLKALPDDGHATISANAIAAALEMGEVKVRKDLAAVSSAGRPKVGYHISDLKHDLQQYLCGGTETLAVLAGAGCIGEALLRYEGFAAFGLRIAAAFDADASRVGNSIGGVEVFPAQEMTDYCRRNNVRVGILTVPQEHAQGCLDEMVKGGVEAVWSFAPGHLNAPQGVLVMQENMNGTLAVLKHHLTHE